MFPVRTFFFSSLHIHYVRSFFFSFFRQSCVQFWEGLFASFVNLLYLNNKDNEDGFCIYSKKQCSLVCDN